MFRYIGVREIKHDNENGRINGAVFCLMDTEFEIDLPTTKEANEDKWFVSNKDMVDAFIQTYTKKEIVHNLILLYKYLDKDKLSDTDNLLGYIQNNYINIYNSMQKLLILL